MNFMLLCRDQQKFRLACSMVCAEMIWKTSRPITRYWSFRYGCNIKLNLRVLSFILSTNLTRIMRTKCLLGFTPLASNVSTRNLTIGTICALCSDNENGVSSGCRENWCGSKFMQTLKMCHSRFLDVCELCLKNDLYKSKLCLQNQCGSVSRRRNKDATVY